VIPDNPGETGLVKIHNNVIASVAYIAALEIDGVSRVCEDMRSRTLQWIGKRTLCGAIDVRQEKNENLTLVIPLIVKYGYNIPEVAGRVQDRVRAAVEETTDLSPKDIIIKIKGVEKTEGA
jgi:uncharacterized alkaline shock family protein YloU